MEGLIPEKGPACLGVQGMRCECGMSEIQRGMAWHGMSGQAGSLNCPARSQAAPDWTALLSLSGGGYSAMATSGQSTGGACQ